MGWTLPHCSDDRPAGRASRATIRAAFHASGDRRQYVKSVVLLAVTAVSLYLLLPGLISVFSSWRSLEHLDWPFAVLVLLFELASSFCLWEVDRIALASNGWFPIACAQFGWQCAWPDRPWLGDAVHGGDAAEGWVDGGEAAASLTASTGLQITTALTLPVLALPAMIGERRNAGDRSETDERKETEGYVLSDPPRSHRFVFVDQATKEIDPANAGRVR